MKTIKNICLLMVLTMSSFSFTAQTTQEPVFYIVEAMKAMPGKNAEYVNAERAVWKRIHQERIKQGLIIGWEFYAVRSPYGTTADHDYITITSVRGWKKVENPWGDLFTGGVANLLTKEQLTIVASTGELRNLLRQNIFMGRDFVMADPKAVSPGKYLIVNAMKVKEGMTEEYVHMETQLVKPVHIEMMKSVGGRSAWGLYTRIMPTGDNQPFDFVTIDYFNKWEDMAPTGGFRAALEKVHPGMSEAFFSKRVNESRELVSAELWELLESVR